MAVNKLNKKEIKQEALKLLNQGISKQETFEILKEKYEYAIEIANVLKKKPSVKAIEKYRKWNNILLGLLILTSIFFILTTPMIQILIWYVFLIYTVARMLVKYYIWTSIFSGFAIITYISILILDVNATNNLTYILPILTLVISTFILPIWLEKKMCPKPVESKVEYTNSDGQKRLKIVYQFSDL